MSYFSERLFWLEGPERSDYLVFSSQDLPFVQRSLAVIQENAELEVHTIRRGPVDLVVLVAIEPRGPKHDSGAP